MGKSKRVAQRSAALEPSMLDPKGRVEVWAAGGMVTRRRRGKREVLVVHRPGRADWSLPKGKLDPGETLADAALREVHEETGLRCRLGAHLPVVRYRDARGRRKGVVYFEMKVIDGEFAVNDEVDEVRWVDRRSARKLLTYERDREFVEEVMRPVERSS